MKKYFFGVSEVHFLGNLVNAYRVNSSPEKVQAIYGSPKPITLNKFPEYLGVTTFCSHCIPDYAKTQAPLSALTIGSIKGKIGRCWNPEAEGAFRKAKADLAQARYRLESYFYCLRTPRDLVLA